MDLIERFTDDVFSMQCLFSTNIMSSYRNSRFFFVIIPPTFRCYLHGLCIVYLRNYNLDRIPIVLAIDCRTQEIQLQQ